jgi:flagellar biosynthesis chaperone FliJ
VAQFRYRLQTLLDQKAKAKEDAQHALAAAQRELSAEQVELDVCRGDEAAAAETLRLALAQKLSPPLGGWNGELLRLRRGYIGRMEDEYNDASDATRTQELRVSEAEEGLGAARDTLATRSRDVEVLEKHRARLERRFHDEAARKEGLDQEEMANIIFLKGRKAI